MKFSLAAQFLSPVFAAAVASSSLVSSVAEELAKKYDTHRDIDAAAAAAATSLASRNLDSTHSTSTSKSSKSSSYCPPDPTKDVECGNVYNSTATGEEVVVTLGQNLLCSGNVTEADGSPSRALTLVGKDAVLDCQGYTISQTTVDIDGIDKGSAAAVDCDIFPINSTELLRMKQECGLYYPTGVRLFDGASMKNCNIQQFYYGGAMTNGGKIEDSEFSLNHRGVQISNRGANTVSKVVNSEIYNNYAGLYTFQYNETDAKVMIEDVAAKSNEYLGMYLTGTGITVNNAITRNNYYGLGIASNAENNDITLAGDITATNNEYGFDTSSSAKGTVYVTGDFNLNRNEEVGLEASSPDLTIAVGGSYSEKSGKSVGSGSLIACDNGLYDIFNFGGSTFEGSDYTCGTTEGAGVPECEPCYPGCSSPEPNESSFHIASAAFKTKDVDFADHMDHEEFSL